MSLFSRSKETTAMAEPETTGIDVLRAATKSRRFKGHLGLLARDLQVTIGDLEAFADSGKQLPPAVLQALAKELFNAELDVEANKLRSLNKAETKPMGISLPPFDPNAPVAYPGRPDLRAGGITLGPPSMMPSQLRPARRAGWVE
jgi:hypothetical protein